MRPALTQKNVGDVPLGYAVSLGKHAIGDDAGHEGLTYFNDLLFGEFHGRMLYTTGIGSMRNPVRLVFNIGAPLKIAKPVVRSIAIREVAAHHSGRAGADERFQNQTVDSPRMLDVPFTQSDLMVARFLANLRPHDLPPRRLSFATRPVPPHASIIANPIVWELRNKLVFDFHKTPSKLGDYTMPWQPQLGDLSRC